MRRNPHQALLSDAAPVRLDRSYSLDELPTPALVIDQGALDRNLEAMAQWLGRHGLNARPHAKTHKCPLIAHRQIAAGAIGVCCAKVAEAEVMVHSGVESVLVTSPVVTAEKVVRVVELARQSPGFGIVVDSERGARLLSEAAAAESTRVPVLIDLDPGTHRTGIAFGEPALELARFVTGLPAVELWGLQSYAGHLMHLESFEERKERSLEIWRQAAETRALIERDGIGLPVLTGGGTGTFDIDATVDGLSDMQVGSYCFMDSEYRAIGPATKDNQAAEPGDKPTPFEPFETSLFVLTTAISQPVPHLITVDAGFKAMAPTPKVRPECLDVEGLTFHFAGDEHGVLQLGGEDETPDREIALGDKLRFRVPHCDPTVNLFDYYYIANQQTDGSYTVEELWPIAARGRSQ